MTNTITATFPNRSSCETALNQLEMIGIAENQCSVLASETARSTHFDLTDATKAPEGATAGASVGGLAGGVLGAVATAGALAIPGLNVIVGGWLIGALAGLGTGALTGGLLGGLIGAGIPEHEAKLHESALHSGSILVAVTCADSEQESKVREVLKHNDATSIAA